MSVQGTYGDLSYIRFEQLGSQMVEPLGTSQGSCPMLQNGIGHRIRGGFTITAECQAERLKKDRLTRNTDVWVEKEWRGVEVQLRCSAVKRGF